MWTSNVPGDSIRDLFVPKRRVCHLPLENIQNTWKQPSGWTLKKYPAIPSKNGGECSTQKSPRRGWSCHPSGWSWLEWCGCPFWKWNSSINWGVTFMAWVLPKNTGNSQYIPWVGHDFIGIIFWMAALRQNSGENSFFLRFYYSESDTENLAHGKISPFLKRNHLFLTQLFIGSSRSFLVVFFHV